MSNYTYFSVEIPSFIQLNTHMLRKPYNNWTLDEINKYYDVSISLQDNYSHFCVNAKKKFFS